MVLHEIKKQKLLFEPFSKDALKLIKAIYNTYIELGGELYLELKLTTVEHLLSLKDNDNSISYLEKLLEEINEPIMVRDFKFYRDLYPMRFLTFCTYTIEERKVNIAINEEYLLAEQEYMLDPFLSK